MVRIGRCPSTFGEPRMRVLGIYSSSYSMKARTEVVIEGRH